MSRIKELLISRVCMMKVLMVKLIKPTKLEKFITKNLNVKNTSVLFKGNDHPDELGHAKRVQVKGDFG